MSPEEHRQRNAERVRRYRERNRELKTFNAQFGDPQDLPIAGVRTVTCQYCELMFRAKDMVGHLCQWCLFELA